jgi:hypothetical protein
MGFLRREDRRLQDQGVSGPAQPTDPTMQDERGRAPRREIAFPELDRAEFVYSETVRAVLPDEEDGFWATEQLGEHLRDVNDGYGFGGVVRDSRGRPVSPAWMDTKCCAVAGSRVGIGATVSHLGLEEPMRHTALDLGARDLRNDLGWDGGAPQGLGYRYANLFLGDTDERWLEMVEIGGDLFSIDAAPDGLTFAVAEWWAGIGAVALANAGDGSRRLLGTVPDLGGMEPLSFSPDGRWLLVPRYRDPLLLEIETRKALSLPTTGDLAWWPARGTSTLMWLDQQEPGSGVIKAYDLGSGAVEVVRHIVYPDAPGLELDRYRLNFPDVNAAGTQVLCGTYFGAPSERQREHGSRERVSLLDIETGVVAPLVAAFVREDPRLEREHRGYRWLDRPPTTEPISISASLHDTAVELGTLEPSNFEFASQHAFNLAVACLGTMIGEDGNIETTDPDLFRAEALRALIAVKSFSPSHLGPLSDWLEQCKMIQVLAPYGRKSDGWELFYKAWERIDNPGLGPVDWEGDRFLQ